MCVFMGGDMLCMHESLTRQETLILNEIQSFVAQNRGMLLD